MNQKVLAFVRFVTQSDSMESNWAAEHLQVIRTLMERSALYRRALAPIMIFNGIVGGGAAVLGWALRVGSVQAFILFWAAVAVVGLTHRGLAARLRLEIGRLRTLFGSRESRPGEGLTELTPELVHGMMPQTRAGAPS